MASHRTEVRNAIVARILSEMPGQFKIVKPSRRFRVGKNKMPACFVYIDDEDIAPITIQSPRDLQRDLDAQIEILIYGTQKLPPDEAMDLLLKNVEQALQTSDNLGLSYVLDVLPSKIATKAEEEEADQLYLAAIATFRVSVDLSEY